VAVSPPARLPAKKLMTCSKQYIIMIGNPCTTAITLCNLVPRICSVLHKDLQSVVPT